MVVGRCVVRAASPLWHWVLPLCCPFQVLLKNTLKSNVVSELSVTLPPSSGMLYHTQSGQQIPLRRSADVWKVTCFLIDFSFSVSAGLTVHCNFSISCQDPLYLLVLVFLWEKKISFSALSIQVNGTMRYKNGHHHHHSFCVCLNWY